MFLNEFTKEFQSNLSIKNVGIILAQATSKLGNYTESIMLIESANNALSSPIHDVMSAPYGFSGSKDPAKTLIAHYLEGIPYDDITHRARYWHGYLVFLNPLLEIMSYKEIRILNGIVQLTLVIWISILLRKRGTSQL